MLKKNISSWFDFGQFSKLKALFIVLFGALYFVVWIPFPFIFPWKEYLPGPVGVPVNIWFWVIIQILTGILFLVLIFSTKAQYLYDNEEDD